MIRFFHILSFSFLLTATVAASEIVTPHCIDICPRDRRLDAGPTTGPVIVVRGTHSLAADPESKLARWVAYKITPESLTLNLPVKRTRRWATDPALADTATLEPADYKGAFEAVGFNRGHLAPLASLGAAKDWEALNYLSNIAPQRATLNSGAWEKLESAERRLITRGDVAAVHVMTGPLFEREMPSLPQADETHRVPSGFWKVVSIITDGGIERAAFIFDQETPKKASHCSGLVPIGDVERRAGLSFTPKGGGILLLSAPPRKLDRRLGCAP